ncbi:hypothetical protein Bacsa_2627 [Phocaeicola salanitronis DSM 18170]|uniref:Uncharacterized protein n=1 Tax=Phocaeicola salanitronis (strain DSM 18170 / JCM 13657 / CCUG 60908 / BL78) TaxID=667015 RepID=F0QZB4_PHOSB|nr:hypothetical protein Bacsa_2627 [Phocaeicola salanitronis DSM 18170]
MPQDTFPFPIRIRHGTYDDKQRAYDDEQYDDVPAYQYRRNGADDAPHLLRAKFNTSV